MTASLSPQPPGVAPRTDVLVDVDVLDELADMLADEDTVRELVRMLVASLPDRVRTLQEAEGRREAETLRRTAHALKSASRQLGAGALADAAEAVEAGRAEVGALEPLVAPTVVELGRWSGDDVVVAASTP